MLIYFFIFRSQLEILEGKTLKRIGSSCKTLGKTGLETTAYLRALGESKGLNVDKHRKQLETELKSDSEDGICKYISNTFQCYYFVYMVLSPWLIQIDFISVESPPDRDELVPLPDLGEGRPDDDFYGPDASLFEHDIEHLSDSSEPLVKDETPFYANQLEDSEIAANYLEWIYGDD